MGSNLNPNTKPEIHAHDLSSPLSHGPLKQALALLHRPENFKISLPLSRRLQFGRRKENTWLLTNLILDRSPPGDNGNAQQGVGEPWLIVFVDRACRPETEVWLFGSWEVSNRTIASNRISSLLGALITTLKSLPLAPSIHTPSLSQTPDSTVMLWGAIHEATIPYLRSFNLLPELAEPKLVANDLFIFPISALPDSGPLPPGFQWGKLKEQHFALVKARTSIPRQDRTLAILPNLAIYPPSTTTTTDPSFSSENGEGEPAPIAWAFIGLDSSLTSLHVEAPYRRLGLARKLTTKLLREELGEFVGNGMEEDEKVAFGYVVEGNDASASMCRSLGGESGWRVYWVRVDVGKV